MSKCYALIVVLLACSTFSFAQVGINTTTPDPSSILDISSTNTGVLLPRMTAAQRDNIASPAQGLFIYVLDSECFQYYKGSSWSGCLGEVPTNTFNCGATGLNGSYAIGIALTATNNITIDVLVNVIEPYTINTDPLNGYSFSASGVFTSVGINTITLEGTGTPLTAQTDTFTINFDGRPDTCTIDVSPVSVLANCLEYLNAGSTTDGIYTIDPDGAGPNAPYDCYCDMTNDGGGWTLVFNHNVSGGYWASDAQASEFNVASPGLGTDKYSILSRLDEIKSAAAYEFRLYYPTLNLRNHWSQTFDPRSGSSSTRPVAGYTPIAIQMAQNRWGGLELSGVNTYLDGSVNSGNWYYSIGSRASWSTGGIPSNSSPVPQVQLFVR